MADVKLLDCTLRDGGYINDWHWGLGSARRIIQSLTRAGTDIVEVGFLRNVDGYDPDVTVCNTIEELNRLLPPESQRGHTIYSGMAMRSNYDISKLSPYDGHGIEVIRITAHDYDIRDGMDFALLYDPQRRLMHIGIDTVTLEGRPFTAHVKVGDHVKAGQLLMDVDLDAIRAAGLDPVTPVIVTNAEAYTRVTPHAGTTVRAGESLVELS